MVGRSKDKVCIITGTGDGMGRAAAFAFCAEGAKVVGCDINEETADHAGKLSPQESETVLSRAAAKAIKEQQDLSLDEWTGGEYFTDDFILHMHKCPTGLEVDKPQADEVFDYDAAHAKVVGKITVPHGLGYLEAFRWEKKVPVDRKREPRSPRGGEARSRARSDQLAVCGQCL